MKKRTKRTKHDVYIDDLAELIKDQYLIILKNVTYGPSFSTIGEIDVLAIAKNQFDIYEVKASNNHYNLKKAVEQVKRARNNLGHEGSEFLYTPNNGIEPIKKN